ncbi:MAG: polyprenyl synthetase family protein [Rickettsiales bacterium]|nr:polyprenyl synthetase family protein [Rickettsiales bacterium]
MSVAQEIDTSQPSASLQSLQQCVADDLLKVNQVIINKVSDSAALIGELAAHIVNSGGKRLRPALTIACAKLCGYEGERHVNLAACVEFIHTATLLHDDVVDESKLRRGLATANDIWGNKSSVLVGDFLFSRSFQLMVEDGSLDVLRILSNASATISEGEVKQLMTTNAPETTEQQYLDVIRSKTAALFAASCELGAVVSDQPEKQQQLHEFGLNLGIAFQLVDDALDYSANQAELGKTVGDDFREGKITLPVIIAYQLANEDEKAFFQRTLSDLEQEEGDLQKAFEIINSYNAIELTFERAGAFAEQASRNLADFPESVLKAALQETVDFCVERAY